MRGVTLVPGDGQEIVTAMRRVVEISRARIEWEVVEGADPALIAASARRTRVAVKGPTPVDAALGKELDLFAVIVPCRAMTGARTDCPEMDAVLVVGHAAGGDRERLKRISHAAFTHAAMQARRQVTVMHQPENAADQIFREVALDVANDYPAIDVESRDLKDVDPCGSGLDVLLVPDSCAGILPPEWIRKLGGTGVVPKVLLGENLALFEGRGATAIILAAALMLEHINEHQACGRIRRAVETVVAGNGSAAGISGMTDAIVAAMR